MAESSTSSRAVWTEDMEKTLIDVLLNEVRLGKRADSGFKAESYVKATKAVNSTHGTQLIRNQIRSKYNALKKRFDVWTQLCNNSGFGWDAENELPTAPPDVWDRYLKMHPAARDFRYKTLRFRLEQEELFEGTRATGELAITPAQLLQLPVASEVPVDPALSDIQAPAPVSSNLNSSKRSAGEEGDEYNEEESEVVKKPRLDRDAGGKAPQRERKSAGKEIARALLAIKEAADAQQEQARASEQQKKLSTVAVEHTKTETAIIKLQDEYEEKLTEEEMVTAMQMFENATRAEIFLALKPGGVRDKWIQRLIRDMTPNV